MARKKRRRGGGSCWQLPSGSWRAEVPVPGGRPHRKTFPTEREAVRWQTATAAARDARSLPDDPGRATVNDRIDVWLANARGTIDPSTHASYESELGRLVRPGLGPVRLADLTPARAKGWLDALADAGWSADKRGRAVQQARAVLAADVGTLLPANPLAKLKRPRAARKPVAAYTRVQADALLAAARAWAGGRWAVLVRLGLDSGMRPQELRALRWEDVDLAAGLVRVRRALRTVKNTASEKAPKSAAGRRDVWLAPGTVAALAAHRAGQKGAAAASGLVFPTRTGTWLAKRNQARLFESLAFEAALRLDAGLTETRHKELRAAWGRAAKAPAGRRAAKAAVLPGRTLPNLGLKALRHTSATLLLAAGAPLKAVSVRLGHESVETTLRFYAAVLPSDQERVRQVATDLFG